MPSTRPIFAVAITGLVLCAALLASSESISAEQALTAAVRVRVHEVRATSLSTPVEVTATTWPMQKATLAAEIQGRVTSRTAEPGSVVEPGATLLGIDDTKAKIALTQSEQDAAARRVDLAKARHDFARGKELFAKAAISQDRLDELRFNVDRANANANASAAIVAERQARLADAAIKAPFAGTVTDVRVHVGDYVSPGTPVATLVDFRQARIIGGVTAAEADRIEGQPSAAVNFEALQGEPVVGQVRSIGRVADPRTGTYPVEAWIDVPKGTVLREGMSARMVLSSARTAAVLAVPPQAVLREGAQNLIYVRDGAVVRKRLVVTGQRTRTAVELRSGIKLGDQVVIEGQFALRDGAAITVEGE
ncbi:MAG: efflux RND transporter periplasmic adaptor subunit [Gammaproteobacteria bacterium]|nr:efflux RND transporter periplasmic adaptor subunit [Gammaproteobacteria bacterium]